LNTIYNKMDIRKSYNKCIKSIPSSIRCIYQFVNKEDKTFIQLTTAYLKFSKNYDITKIMVEMNTDMDNLVKGYEKSTRFNVVVIYDIQFTKIPDDILESFGKGQEREHITNDILDEITNKLNLRLKNQRNQRNSFRTVLLIVFLHNLTNSIFLFFRPLLVFSVYFCLFLIRLLCSRIESFLIFKFISFCVILRINLTSSGRNLLSKFS
jgi:hypothetical protein